MIFGMIELESSKISSCTPCLKRDTALATKTGPLLNKGQDHSPEAVLGESGLLKQLSKRLVERALAAELNYHLEKESEESSASKTGQKNRRNGFSSKTVQSEQGELELSIPRDRQGHFEPILVPKHQRRLAGLDEKILAMYARGLSTRDISAQLEELYGAQVPASLISEVTDSVTEEVKAWQCPPS